jgi:hypothetical protein
MRGDLTLSNNFSNSNCERKIGTGRLKTCYKIKTQYGKKMLKILKQLILNP